MQVEQRSVDTNFDPIKRKWVPELNSDPIQAGPDLDLADDMRYVVVDDIVEGRVSLEVSEWPTLDADGRLHFADIGDENVTRFEGFQALVNDKRTETHQYAPDRPLRIGDSFAITGLSVDETGSIVVAEEVWDISKAARNAAKAAMFGAVASTVDVTYEQEMAISVEVLEVPDEEGVFDVRQEATKTELAGDAEPDDEES